MAMTAFVRLSISVGAMILAVASAGSAEPGGSLPNIEFLSGEDGGTTTVMLEKPGFALDPPTIRITTSGKLIEWHGAKHPDSLIDAPRIAFEEMPGRVATTYSFVVAMPRMMTPKYGLKDDLVATLRLGESEQLLWQDVHRGVLGWREQLNDKGLILRFAMREGQLEQCRSASRYFQKVASLTLAVNGAVFAQAAFAPVFSHAASNESIGRSVEKLETEYKKNRR